MRRFVLTAPYTKACKKVYWSLWLTAAMTRATRPSSPSPTGVTRPLEVRSRRRVKGIWSSKSFLNLEETLTKTTASLPHEWRPYTGWPIITMRRLLKCYLNEVLTFLRLIMMASLLLTLPEVCQALMLLTRYLITIQTRESFIHRKRSTIIML